MAKKKVLPFYILENAKKLKRHELDDFRDKKGWTQERLGIELGYKSASMVNGIINNTNEITNNFNARCFERFKFIVVDN